MRRSLPAGTGNSISITGALIRPEAVTRPAASCPVRHRCGSLARPGGAEYGCIARRGPPVMPKVAVVTGGAGGMGLAVAHVLGREAAVASFDTTSEQPGETARLAADSNRCSPLMMRAQRRAQLAHYRHDRQTHEKTARCRHRCQECGRQETSPCHQRVGQAGGPAGSSRSYTQRRRKAPSLSGSRSGARSPPRCGEHATFGTLCQMTQRNERRYETGIVSSRTTGSGDGSGGQRRAGPLALPASRATRCVPPVARSWPRIRTRT